jgi:hypothetical protein
VACTSTRCCAATTRAWASGPLLDRDNLAVLRDAITAAANRAPGLTRCAAGRCHFECAATRHGMTSPVRNRPGRSRSADLVDDRDRAGQGPQPAHRSSAQLGDSRGSWSQPVCPSGPRRTPVRSACPARRSCADRSPWGFLTATATATTRPSRGRGSRMRTHLIHLRHYGGIDNAPYARALLQGQRPHLLHLWRREQGLIVPTGTRAASPAPPT